MSKRRDPNQLLLDLAQKEGPGVVHLPYTPEFEAVCQQLNPAATLEDKHRFWETLLVEVDTLPTGGASSTQVPPATIPKPEPAALPTSPPAQTSHPHETSGSLFPIDEAIPELQPWSTPREGDLPPEQAQRRQKMLADIADSYLATRELRVADILRRFPETRDSDTALCIRYWKMFQADVLERWRPLELEVLYDLDRIETIGRVRRMIQNELRLFRGIEETRGARQAMQMEFHEYLAAHRDSLPEVRFYLDETGNEGDKAYTGVAGICIINWKQFDKHHAALEQWRSEKGWPETIHFSETNTDKVNRAVSLLQQLQSRRAGILFLGYSLASRGRTHEDLFSLFIQLVVDSLKHLGDCNCLRENCRVRVIKEADTGFDQLFLHKMTKQLADLVALEFPGRLAVLPVEAVGKGRTVLLECADLIAGGMQRRALSKGRNPKDRLAEAVINVTGFEDSADNGAVFKYYAGTGG
ncbi:MAG TPA: hypothetical protein VGP63_01180 [Planctomycetaceae bacterium]|nr:hypothetical protein [Planctomycetaceae bacterium]